MRASSVPNKVRPALSDPRWGPLILFGLVAPVYLATSTPGSVGSGDTLTAGVASWALARFHTFNLAFLPPIVRGSLWMVPGAHGWLVSNRFPGAVLLALPFYLVFGGSAYSDVPGMAAAALASAGALALMYKILLRFHRPRVALAAAGLFAFATSTWTVSGRELWEHGGAQLLIAAGMLAILSRRWVLGGLALGATVLFRPHLGIAAAAVFLGILFVERRWRSAAACGIAALPGVAAFLAWNYVVYGRLTIAAGYNEVGTRHIGLAGVGPVGFLYNIAGSLVSPERGLLICSPILFVALVGLWPAWRSVPPFVKVFTVAGLAYLASQLWLIRFSGGDGFYGYRVTLETLTYCTPLLVAAGVHGVRRIGAAATWILAGLSVAFYAAGASTVGETIGIANPWTTWTPLELAHDYGTGRLVVGALAGAGAVLVAFWAWNRLPGRRATPSLIFGEPKIGTSNQASVLVPEASDPTRAYA